MSSSLRTLLETLTEHPRQFFDQLCPNFTSYYQNFHQYLPTEYFLSFTILISILTGLIILAIMCESKFLFRLSPSTSLLTFLLNSPNYLQKRFVQECRRALNQTLAYSKDHHQIDFVQLSNVTVTNLSHTSNPPAVINATLRIGSSRFTLLNPIRQEQCLVEVQGLTGDLQVSLVNEIEVKFKARRLDAAEIISTNQASPLDGKQFIIKLLTELIHRTTVQFALQEEAAPHQPETPLLTTSPLVSVPEQCETPLDTPSQNSSEQTLTPKETKRLLVRIVKAVKLHDVEQPFCVLELNHPKQVHQTNVAKNGLNPFWDEHFLFECNEKSNVFHLKIIDRRKPNRKSNRAPIEALYADLSIPFSYVTSTIYKQDVRITPQYPESIIRIEFSTLSEEEAAAANNGSDFDSNADTQSWSSHRREAYRIEQRLQQSPSTDVSPNGQLYENSPYNNTPTTFQATPDIYPTPPDTDSRLSQPRKSRSFMSSLRSFASSRRTKNSVKGISNANGVTNSPNSPMTTNAIPHSLSAEPFLYSNATGPTSFRPQHSASRSFRNLFRSGSNKKPLHADNFILDHPDLLSTSPESQKKLSFFQRLRSKRKARRLNSFSNSLTSYDRTRTESVQNTPVRANGGRPVTMNK